MKIIDYNTCYYSPGTKQHATCTHPHYCIFNKHRVSLEKQIHQLSQELQKHIQNLKSIKHGRNYTQANYNETKEAITILNNDLMRLRTFEKNIKKYGGKGYGHN